VNLLLKAKWKNDLGNTGKIAMLTTVDKAWVSGLVSAFGMKASEWFGLTLDTNTQVLLVAVIVAFMTWLVPNKDAAK
jgi:hypothetical protein